jgi:putative membrane-bound dehydrogenase-like protein
MLKFILLSSLLVTTAQAGLDAVSAAKIAPLPEAAAGGGLLFADLNADGHEDLIISNPQQYGVYLFNPDEIKRLQWDRGWSQVLREGRAGDSNSLPLLIDANGKSTGLQFRDAALRDASGKEVFSLSQLLHVPGPPALSPEESLKALKLKPGYAAKLVAHEPLVQDPVYIDWDERGRMWVVEMGDYPFAPGEATKDGRSSQGKGSPLQDGRIKILEDTNADGIYDKATIFLEGLLHPTGLAFWKGGVFISAIPDIIYAKDTNDDGICDEKEPWFSGFTAGNPQHLVNGFAWGLDGWLYGANGDSGGDITCLKTGQKLQLGTHDFRFHPETGEFQLETGRTQYGKWRDDYGNWFGNNNSILAWHYHIPMRYMEQHPDKVPPSVRSVLNSDTHVFTISPPVRRFNLGSKTQVLTAACSPMPWFDGKHESLLVCEPANNLIRRDVLDYTQFPITSQRHPEDKESEFIASTDNWFRPAHIREGPDGALYVVDMYRLVLEHPEWIPAEIVKGLDLRAGEDRGRIFRIAGPKAQKRSLMQLSHLPTAMRSAQRWQRDTAQRLLLQSSNTEALPWLVQLANDQEASKAVRLQAAWSAALLDEKHRPALLKLAQSFHPRVRGAALVAAGGDTITSEELASWFPKPNDPVETTNLPVLTRSSKAREAIVQDYLQKVSSLKGDPKRGEIVYQKACMACHRLGNSGAEVGPALETVAAKPVDQILEAIFDPNKAVEQRNAATQITQTDGVVLVGLISAETPGGISLRLPGGVDIPIPRSKIRSVKTLTNSLMPEGLESVLTAQETADLLSRMQGR